MRSANASLSFGRGMLLSVIAVICFIALVDAKEPDPIIAMLRQRVKENPQHADSWRLIAKIHHRAGQSDQAIDALGKALAADPESVASHFDLGQVLESMGDTEAAFRHYATVRRLAPESSYARQLIERGFSTGIPSGEDSNRDATRAANQSITPPLTPVGYEIQTFDGSEMFERQLETLDADAMPPHRRWRAFVESGLLYNTNVSLTPISRQLDNVDGASFQGFLNPEIECLLFDGELIRSGPLTRGYFALNERHQSEFDLASFQAGWFAERDFGLFGRDTVGRVDYVYSLDLQGSVRFADRHSLSVSATSVFDGGDILYLYATLNVSDFNDAGVDPNRDSLDGPGFIGGVTRFFRSEGSRLPTFRLGSDVSSANTTGTDYRYVGANVHGGFAVALPGRLSVEPEMGLGFRIYDDFTDPVDRDEVIIRIAVKVNRPFSDRLTLSLVVGHDRFASDNEDFDAERTEGGIVTSWFY